MAHELIVGITESGKTTLGINKSNRYLQEGIESIILDPMRDDRWQSEYVFDDPHEFIATVKASRHCAVFVDEAGETIGRFGGEMNFLATRGRHYGHVCHFLAQRANMIDVNVRTNCAILNMFKQSVDDCKILASNFAQEELRKGNTLGKGEFYYCDGFSDVVKYKIF